MSIAPPPEPIYTDSQVTIYAGDCLDVLRTLPDASVDAVVTDPPYGLEFMGKGWDAPWRESDVNADAGMSKVGYTDGAKRLPRPSFTGSTNPKCLVCKGTRRGRRDGTAKVAVCLCEDGGRFPNVRAVEMRAFAEWCETWTTELYRVLKPGGHMLAFGGTRTWHRLACAVEDAGFEVRDSLAWLYGSGFPKSLDVSKAIDKAAGADREVVGQRDTFTGDDKEANTFMASPRLMDITAPATPEAEQWQGWGTALKPAFEPIVVARKPLAGTVAANVLAHGTGALNIDGCRVDSGDDALGRTNHTTSRFIDSANGSREAHPRTVTIDNSTGKGRWPANVVLDEAMAAALDEQSGELTSGKMMPTHTTAGTEGRASCYGADAAGGFTTMETYGDTGGASRFFYVAKADSSERVRVNGTAHPTVKPLALMRWLVRLVTPPGGTVLEPFAGSGTTVEACILEGFRCIAIEREADYLPLIRQRIHRRSDPVQAVKGSGEDGGLFDLLDGGAA